MGNKTTKAAGVLQSGDESYVRQVYGDDTSGWPEALRERFGVEGGPESEQVEGEKRRLAEVTAAAEAERDRLRVLHRKYKTLYDDLRIRISVLQSLDDQIKAAAGIIEKAVKPVTSAKGKKKKANDD